MDSKYKLMELHIEKIKNDINKVVEYKNSKFIIRIEVPIKSTRRWNTIG